VVGQAEDGQANALDRAYEAEAAARRLESELAAARTRVGHLEQVRGGANGSSLTWHSLRKGTMRRLFLLHEHRFVPASSVLLSVYRLVVGSVASWF
jgi:hypothetical protein